MGIMRCSGVERGRKNIKTFGKRLAENLGNVFGANKETTRTERQVMKKVRTRKRRYYKGEEHPSF